MLTYAAPLRDMRFVLDDLLGVEDELGALPGCEETTLELIEAVLTEAARLSEGTLLPLNQTGDAEGCRLEGGRVYTPGGFKAAYDAFVAGGWCGVGAAPEHGGQGLPKVVSTLVNEMIGTANLSFGDYVGVFASAYLTIDTHASEALKARYLPGLATGRLGATMAMTEPHCGTDLGLLRTRAVPREDGIYGLTGSKIFTSAGDHDLTDNIVHLVLARLPDAPAGSRGISLFLVPKILPSGARNGVTVGRLEHKMGYAASATCQMHFDDATAWLVGEAHKGLRAVNDSRLMVAQQGLCTAETAYQSAVVYARERLQGRAPDGPRFPDREADPIIVHPDVRIMLLRTRAFTEAARALSVWAALPLDKAARHPDPSVRDEADDPVALTTPILKASFSDDGFECCNLCMQVFGGHGYIRDNGMEQLVRDCRIAQIQEGANGIQALDLVGRKLRIRQGTLPGRLFALFDEFLAGAEGRPELAPYAGPLGEAVGCLRELTDWLRSKIEGDPVGMAVAATAYQRVFALILYAWMWARMASVSLERRDDPFYARKLATADFFMARALPMVHAHASIARAGSATVTAIPDDGF